MSAPTGTTDELALRYRIAPPERTAETGVTGYFVTNQVITPAQEARLRQWWATRPQLVDCQVVRI